MEETPLLVCPLCGAKDHFERLWVHFIHHHQPKGNSWGSLESGAVVIERMIHAESHPERATCPICQEKIEVQHYHGLDRRTAFCFLLHLIEHQDTHAVAWMMML